MQCDDVKRYVLCVMRERRLNEVMSEFLHLFILIEMRKYKILGVSGELSAVLDTGSSRKFQ